MFNIRNYQKKSKQLIEEIFSERKKKIKMVKIVLYSKRPIGPSDSLSGMGEFKQTRPLRGGVDFNRTVNH